VRLALIANPRSGTAPEPAEICALLEADGAAVSCVAIDAIADEDGGQLTDGALNALRAAGAPDRIVVAGGDGSIGPAALCAARLRIPLAVIAVGTANDFARAKQLPRDVAGACALARDPRATTAHAELATAGVRPFVNSAAAGLSVSAARAAAPLKSRLGPLAYTLGALRAGLSASALRCTVACDGEQHFDGSAWQVVIAVTGAFGGGSATGGTRTSDGLLDVAVVPAGLRAGLIWRAVGMRTGRLTEQRDVAHERGRVIDVQIPAGAAFNVDGETCRCDPARFTIREGGFDVVVSS